VFGKPLVVRAKVLRWWTFLNAQILERSASTVVWKSVPYLFFIFIFFLEVMRHCSEEEQTKYVSTEE